MLDWDELEKYAFGYLSMRGVDFYAATPREFTNRLRGYLEVREQDYRVNAEFNRNVMHTMVLTSFADKKTKRKTAQQLFPLPWDGDNSNDLGITTSSKTAIAFWNRVDGI